MIRCSVCRDLKPKDTLNINGECESCSEICEVCFTSTYYVGELNSERVCYGCSNLKTKPLNNYKQAGIISIGENK